jgi:glycine dehydrogenase subunit 1
MHKYLPHTDSDLREMLAFLGISDIKELFSSIPKAARLDREYDLPPAMSELELRRHFQDLAKLNETKVVFSGLGAYDHYDPSVLSALVSRQEFLTSYTPYQPEVAQGTLQYIFEYQSMIAALTGMDVSNASMYDGPTAAAEAMFMAEGITRRKRILVSKSLFPHVKDVLKTYAHFKGLEIDWLDVLDGSTDFSRLNEQFTDAYAGLFVQKTNVFGIVEDFAGVADLVHQKGGVFIVYSDISALAVLKTPGEEGADIAVGDCQALGIPLAFGGPYLGYMAVKKTHVRKMPGRICGQTFDKNGKRSFVLTLQAREQHIRREKANSNICSNQSLMALYVTIYLSLLGKDGIRTVNELSYQGAHALYDKLLATGKFKKAFDKPFLKEFTVESLIPSELMQKALRDNGFFGAYPLVQLDPEWENLYNFAVTEKRSGEEIDRLVQVLGGLSW